MSSVGGGLAAAAPVAVVPAWKAARRYHRGRRRYQDMYASQQHARGEVKKTAASTTVKISQGGYGGPTVAV